MASFFKINLDRFLKSRCTDRYIFSTTREKYLYPLNRFSYFVFSCVSFFYIFETFTSSSNCLFRSIAGSETRRDKRHRFLFATSSVHLLIPFWQHRGGGSRKWGSEDGSLSSERSRGCNRASSHPYSDDQTDSELFCMYLHHDWPLLLPSGQWSNSQSSKSCLSFM